MEIKEFLVWAVINTKTGEVCPEPITPYDDSISDRLVDGYEWRKFKLVPIE